MRIKLKSKRPSVSYILDNGAYTAKIGNSSLNQPEVIPNCIMKVKSEKKRPFIGDQINECRDASGLYYILPFQRGYSVNWDTQKKVWDYIFTKDICRGRLSEHPICITEPIYNFQSNQEAMNEIFFEEYDCCGMLRVTAPDLCAYHYSKTHNDFKSMIVIDTGYSFTHIIPYIDGVKYLPGIKRINIGGKILTNHLKEIISYRQMHVMDETHVVNQAKEDACYVSLNFRSDMDQVTFKDKRNKIVREYVLPNYSTINRGYVREIDDDAEQVVYKVKNKKMNSLRDSCLSQNGFVKVPNGLKLNGFVNSVNSLVTESIPDKSTIEQQTIVLNNERITIPEILFHPSDIGIQQMGIAESIVDCIKSCPDDMKYRLLGNIIVTGGNAMFPNFGKRLYMEVRQRFDEFISVNVSMPNNTVTYPWHGGKLLTAGDDFYKHLVTREDYEENGHQYTRKHFRNFKI